MDAQQSDKYNIGRYGNNGMEVIRHGRSVRKFTEWPTAEMNWLAALNWATDNHDSAGVKENCPCRYCQIMREPIDNGGGK